MNDTNKDNNKWTKIKGQRSSWILLSMRLYVYNVVHILIVMIMSSLVCEQKKREASNTKQSKTIATTVKNNEKKKLDNGIYVCVLFLLKNFVFSKGCKKDATAFR